MTGQHSETAKKLNKLLPIVNMLSENLRAFKLTVNKICKMKEI